MPIDELPFGREVTICAVGDGLGLPGIVAASRGAVPVVVERDPRLWEFIHRNYVANQVWGRFRPFSWSEVIDVFDCAVGSEIIYPGFGMSELCKFIDRCWNRKLPCYFGASSDCGSDEFMSGLETYKISVRRRLHDFQMPDSSAGVCYLWELTP
jgi:predicted nicotinamide N-methyase